MRKLIIFLLFFSFLFCSNRNKFEMGTYRSYVPSRIEQYYNLFFNRINGYLVKANLTINHDSSFIFSTCSSISTGSWRISTDSLYLNVNKCIWKNDSLNKFGFKSGWPANCSKPIVFKFENNELRGIISSRNGYKTIIILKINLP